MKKRHYLLFILIAALAFGIDWRKTPKPEEGDIPLYLVDNGMHISFVFPSELAALAPEKLKAAIELEQGAFTLLGWGDRGFYMEAGDWNNLELGTVVPALFWPSESVLYLYSGDFDLSKIPDDDIATRWLSLEDYCALFAAIDAEMQSGAPLGSGQFAQGQFYQAKSGYHAFFTCNSWTAKQLREIGIPASPLLAQFSWPLMRELEWRGFEG